MCSTFKKKRLAKLNRYYDAYALVYKPKNRQAFNIPLPVFSGFVDQTISNFNDPLNLEFSAVNKALMPQLTQANEIWKAVNNSLDPAANFRLQTYLDRKNAVITGVGIQKCFAESDPKFKFHFEALNLKKFIFEPKGGPILAKHLFKGQEGIYKTELQLTEGKESGRYNSEAVDTILANLKDQNYRPLDYSAAITGEFLQGYKAFQQDPESNNYTGAFVSNNVEMVLMYSGKWYYILFDPYCKEALIADDLKNIVESGREPYTCYHTHPDDEVFMSKSYGDDFYTIHDAVCTSINQELTNRRKKNSNARYYDDEIFTDLTKLDEGQWRDDALVPVDTKGGTRKISEGIYQFDSNEMTGTIDLVNFLEGDMAKNTGSSPTQGGQAKGKQAQIQMALLQEGEKRQSDVKTAIKECYQQVGLRFLDGISEHLPQAGAIDLIGSQGYGWTGVKEKDRINVKVINVTEEDKQNVLGKDQKKQGLDSLMQNPTTAAILNPKAVAEFTLKDISGWDEESVDRFMDTENYGNEDLIEVAEYCVQRLLKGKMPKPVFNANGAFLKYIADFESKHQADLKPEISKMFIDYILNIAQIVKSKQPQPAQSAPGQQDQNQNPAPGGGGPAAPTPPGGMNTPVSRQQKTMAPAMSKMAVSGGMR